LLFERLLLGGGVGSGQESRQEKSRESDGDVRRRTVHGMPHLKRSSLGKPDP